MEVRWLVRFMKFNFVELNVTIKADPREVRNKRTELPGRCRLRRGEWVTRHIHWAMLSKENRASETFIKSRILSFRATVKL